MTEFPAFTVLSNVSYKNFSQGYSSVYVLQNGSLKDILWNRRDIPSYPSIDAWQQSLVERGLPLGIRINTVLSLPSVKLSGTISISKCKCDKLSNGDQTSKVVVLKDLALLEVRRGDLTFTKEIKKTTQPHVWNTIQEWTDFLKSSNMNMEIKTEDGLTVIA